VVAIRSRTVWIKGLIAACGVVMTGCASGGGGRAYTPVYWPPAPDTARVQYLGSYATSYDFQGGRSSFWQNLVGTQGEEGRGIIKPYGISSRGGRFYVCDTVQRSVEILDIANDQYDVFEIAGPERFITPVNCFMDPDTGWLHVTDTQREQILIFDEEGGWIGAIDAGADSRFADVFVYGGRIWATDVRHGKVRVFDQATREEIDSFPSFHPDEPGWLGAATGIWVTEDRVYVSDVANGRVQVYSHDGEYVMTVGSYGDALGQFARPKGIAVDRDGVLYVVDAAFGNIQMFDREGRLLTWFGGAGNVAGDMAIPAQVTLDYESVDLFRSKVGEDHELAYLILVTNQYGNDKVSVYGRVNPSSGGFVESNRED
jgi:DNA-binding beta-propeller fold protein YncE